jgi:hypothetical protein
VGVGLRRRENGYGMEEWLLVTYAVFTMGSNPISVRYTVLKI